MKKTILRFGCYAFLTALLLFIIILYFGQGLDLSLQEVLGYVTIFAALAFIFPAIKHFRENENKGTVTFKSALLIGLTISGFAAMGFTIADTIYVTQINPNFAQEYFEYSLEKMEDELSSTDYEIQKAELQEKIKQYSHPAFNAIVMFLTVFLIGFIVSLLSALILQQRTNTLTE